MNISLLRESFQALKPHSTEVMEYFYGEVFDRHPLTKTWLNTATLDKRNRVHANILAHVVEFIEDKEHVTDYLRKIGKSYAKSGSEPEHFQWIAEALLATFSYYFDGQWTPELKQSWTRVFELMEKEISAGMKTENRQVESHKVVEMKHQPSLSELAHNIAQELLKKAILDEVSSPAFQQAIREKAQELLNQAIQAEAAQMLSESRALVRSA